MKGNIKKTYMEYYFNLFTRAQKAGILIMNEVGLDPGIDHMSAMKIIDEAKRNGSKVKRHSLIKEERSQKKKNRFVHSFLGVVVYLHLRPLMSPLVINSAGLLAVYLLLVEMTPFIGTMERYKETIG